MQPDNDDLAPSPHPSTTLVAGIIASNRSRRTALSDSDADTAASALVPASASGGQDDELIADVTRIVGAMRQRLGTTALVPAPQPPQHTVVVVERGAPPVVEHGLIWAAVERHRTQMSVPRACCIFCTIMWMLVALVVSALWMGYHVLSQLPDPPSPIKR